MIVEERLDKWLVFARFVKTRNLAAKIISNGKLRINGSAQTKSHTRIRVGDDVTFIHLDRLYHIKILSIPNARISAKDRESIYEHIEEPVFLGETKPIYQSHLANIKVHKGKESRSRKQEQKARILKNKT